MTDPRILRTFHIGNLMVSELSEPGLVELTIPDGTCRLTKDQWELVNQISAGYQPYGGDFVRFQESAQATLPLSVPAADLEDLQP
jgi:hypothetical protein